MTTLNLLLVALLLNLWEYLATLMMSCQNYVEIVANSVAKTDQDKVKAKAARILSKV